MIIYTDQNDELKAEPSYSVEMKMVVLHIHSPKVIKLQILCRSKEATKREKALVKNFLLFSSPLWQRKETSTVHEVLLGKNT